MRRIPLRVSFSVSCSCAVLMCALVAGRLEGQLVNLGDIVGGGDGSGTAPPENVGINPDTGIFETVHVNANVANTGDNPQVVDPGTSPYIDSVFILDVNPIAINSELVQFNFDPGDTSGSTWNHILSDLTHDVDKGINEVRAGGSVWSTGIGIHASAGITFNLEEIRAAYPDSVKYFIAFAGSDGCGNMSISLYAIFSDDTEIISSQKVGPLTLNQGSPLQLEIPTNALFLTLAVGAVDNGIGCDHGVFANASISPVPLPTRDLATAGDPAACPPAGVGPVTATIKQAVGPPPGEVVTVTERVTGSFGAAQVTATNGGTVTTIPHVPPAPVPVGVFGDHRNVVLDPVCVVGQGDTVEGPAGTYTLTNVGNDIWQGGDTFQFAYNKVTGNFDVTAHIADRVAAPGARWGKHGLMARQDLSPRSRYTFSMDAIGDPSTDADNNDDSNVMAARPTHGGNNNFENVTAGMTPIGSFGDDTNLDDSCGDGLGLDDGTCTVNHHDYIRLERVGNVFNAYSRQVPSDPWTLLGSHDWGPGAPATVLVGLAFTSHLADCASPGTVVFDEVSYGGATIAPMTLDPLGVDITWSVPRSVLQGAGLSYTVNVGQGLINFSGNVAGIDTLGAGQIFMLPPPANYGPLLGGAFPNGHAIGAECPGTGITDLGGGAIRIDGAGEDIWANGDQFMFAYGSMTGDFSARIAISERIFAPGSQWGKHGIMARQDCGIRSRYSFIHDNGENLVDSTRYAVRPTHNGAGNFELVGPVPAGSHYDALRLDRCDNTFIGYVRDDAGLIGPPGEWVEVGRHDWGPEAPATVQLGLAVTSHAACAITSITFEEWEVLPLCQGPVLDLTCTASASGLDLAWRNPTNAPDSPITISVNGSQVGSVPGTATSFTVPQANLPPAQISTIEVRNFSGLASSCGYPTQVTPQGFIREWLILGPLARPGGAAPGDDQIILDFLTDGVSINEIDIRPRAGDSVNPDYGNLASSTGLRPTPGRPDINPGGVPTWFAWTEADDTIDYLDVFAGDINDNVAYAVTYINVTEETIVDIGLGSDDSYHLLVNGVTPTIGGAGNIARGYGAANEVQSVAEDVVLSPGCNIIMLKVFEGGGGHGFRLRFQDDAGNPVLPGSLHLDPTCPTGGGAGFRRGDSNASGDLNITDGVFVLNYLFLGGPEPPCQDAADSDDNGTLNITDGVRILNYLFLGGPAPPAPGPDSCGSDPSADDLPACVYASC